MGFERIVDYRTILTECYKRCDDQGFINALRKCVKETFVYEIFERAFVDGRDDLVEKMKEIWFPAIWQKYTSINDVNGKLFSVKTEGRVLRNVEDFAKLNFEVYELGLSIRRGDDKKFEEIVQVAKIIVDADLIVKMDYLKIAACYNNVALLQKFDELKNFTIDDLRAYGHVLLIAICQGPIKFADKIISRIGIGESVKTEIVTREKDLMDEEFEYMGTKMTFRAARDAGPILTRMQKNPVEDLRKPAEKLHDEQERIKKLLIYEYATQLYLEKYREYMKSVDEKWKSPVTYLTKEDICVNDGFIFRRICENKDDEMMEYLIEKFKLTQADIAGETDYEVCDAMRYVNLDGGCDIGGTIKELDEMIAEEKNKDKRDMMVEERNKLNQKLIMVAPKIKKMKSVLMKIPKSILN